MAKFTSVPLSTWLLGLVLSGCSLCHAQEITIGEIPERSKSTFQLGTAVNPQGRTLLCDSKSMLMDGKPVVPVMGEIHYTRCDEKEWRRELLKMKAGGVTIVATYVFWIHHEEIAGRYDWNGRRDLRKFVEICKELDLPVVLRIGPFCHGEVRNGGLPDWLVDGSYKVRSTDAKFLDQVQEWYSAIYAQVKGLMWKDGGPVVGVQLDNEYRGRWDYLKGLKDIAHRIGFDVPLYTRTGWPTLTSPATFGEILPLYGDYADGFWDRSMKDMPGDYAQAFVFRPSRLSTVIATEQIPNQTGKEDAADLAYPYFTCELGGGMMSSYHRRIHIDPLDIHALAIVKVGSGSNLPGYYMYHGGTNPTGIQHTLNEKQDSPATNSNDMPAVTYDFQAPLGEFGQVNEQYHWLRRLHLFLADFGAELSGMDAAFPVDGITDGKGEDKLRWAVRSDGQSGYVFVNNYQRMRPLSDKKDVRFTLHLPKETLSFPQQAMTIPAGQSCFFPFQLPIGDLTLKYATAQPLAKIEHEGVVTLFLAEVKGVPVELMLSADVTVDSSLPFERTADGVLFKGLRAGKDCVIRTKTSTGQRVHIVVLDEATSLKSYKIQTNQQEYLVITSGSLIHWNDEFSFEQWGVSVFDWRVYPAASFTQNGKKIRSKADGVFTCFQVSKPLTSVAAKLTKLRDGGALRTVGMGQRGVAGQPSDNDFAQAAAWRIDGVNALKDPSNYFLKVTYEGDVAHIYSDGKLVEDNFYNGKPMYVRATSLLGAKNTLEILPLGKDYPIYFHAAVRDKLSEAGTLLQLSKAEWVERNVLNVRLLTP